MIVKLSGGFDRRGSMMLSQLRVRQVSAILLGLCLSTAAPKAAPKIRPNDPDFQMDQTLYFNVDESAPTAPWRNSRQVLERPTAPTAFIFASVIRMPQRLFGSPHLSGAASVRPNLGPIAHSSKTIHMSEVSLAAARNGRRDVAVTIGCDFWAADENGNYWDWTYDAHIFSPTNSSLKHTNEWASQKTGYSSNISVDLSDPPEGDYTCSIDWYADSFYLGPSSYAQTFSYAMPTGETTAWKAWFGADPTLGIWTATLTPAVFKGRQTQEVGGGGPGDTCWSFGDPFDPTFGITGSRWNLTSDSKYDDYIGYTSDAVDYFRNHSRVPCGEELVQLMYINRPGADDAYYGVSNTLKAGITASEVYSERAGTRTTRSW